MLLCLHSCCLRDAKYAFYLFDYLVTFTSMAASGSQFTCPLVPLGGCVNGAIQNIGQLFKQRDR